LAVFRIDRFGPSEAAANAARERIAALLKRRPGARRQANPRLVRAVEIALVAGIGVLLPLIMYQGLGPVPKPPAAPAPAPAAAQSAAAGPINPFRTASAPDAPPAAADAGETLAETTLNLTLHGTWIDAKGGTAIIKTPDEKQGRFAVGDTITGGVTLERVERDHVVIIRNGVREALRLINRDSAAASAGGAAPEALTPAFAGDGMAAIGHFIVATPETDEVGGMRLVLQPADDVEQFEALGLVPGDRLVAVDNAPIDRDIAAGLEAIAMTQGKKSVTLSIERDGVVMPIVIAMPNETVAMPND
jgi:type II secretion system protein C